MSNFVERLIQRSQNSRRISELKPALTPEMVPEIFILPLQKRANNSTGTLNESKQLSMLTEQELGTKDIMNSKTQPSDSPTIQSSPVHLTDTSETIESIQDGSVKSYIKLDTTIQSAVADTKKNSIVSRSEFDVPDSPLPSNINSSQDATQKETFFIHTDREQTKQNIKQLEESTKSLKITSNQSDQYHFSESFDNLKNNLITNPAIQQKTSTNQYQTNPEHIPSEASVTINIGKIEVHAIASDKKFITPKETNPILSLKEYLKQRESGSF